MVASQAKKTKTQTGSSLTATKRFRQPLLFVALGLFVVTGSIMIYSSLAATTPVVNTNADFWRQRIAYCESGGRYNASNGAGHFGAYQFDVRTWRGAVGPELAAQYPNPVNAPAEVQDLAFNNTFARRGSQPWNSSFKCWATDELKGQVPSLSIKIPVLQSTPTPIPTPGRNAYNVTVQGRVKVDNKLTPNVTLVTCVDGVTTKTDAGGIFRFELPAGREYCVRVVDGLPAGAQFVGANNNPEHDKDSSYEHQLASKNYYHDIWQLFTPYYTWDRASDENLDFTYSTGH